MNGTTHTSGAIIAPAIAPRPALAGLLCATTRHQIIGVMRIASDAALTATPRSASSSQPPTLPDTKRTVASQVALGTRMGDILLESAGNVPHLKSSQSLGCGSPVDSGRSTKRRGRRSELRRPQDAGPDGLA